MDRGYFKALSWLKILERSLIDRPVLITWRIEIEMEKKNRIVSKKSTQVSTIQGYPHPFKFGQHGDHRKQSLENSQRDKIKMCLKHTVCRFKSSKPPSVEKTNEYRDVDS
jgi:hypothetical protein